MGIKFALDVRKPRFLQGLKTKITNLIPKRKDNTKWQNNTEAAKATLQQ